MLNLNRITFILCLALLPACEGAKFTGKSGKSKKGNSGQVAQPPVKEPPKTGAPENPPETPKTPDPIIENPEDPSVSIPCKADDAQCIEVCSKDPVQCQVPCTETRKTMCVNVPDTCEDPTQNDRPSQNDDPSQHDPCDNPAQK